MLKMYMRRQDPSQPDSRGVPFGVLVAKPISDNVVRIGWSLCNPNDQFSKKMGTKIAVGRLESDAAIIQTLTNKGWKSDHYGDLNLDDTDVLDTLCEISNEVNDRPQRYQTTRNI